MDTLQERGLLEGLAVRDDRTIDLTELARRALESALNQVMDAQADELRGEGNRRNGYRERRLPAVVGEATPRMPRPGEGGHFPEGLPRPCSRVDRATVACAREAYVRGLSARKMEAAAVTAIACGGAARGASWGPGAPTRRSGAGPGPCPSSRPRGRWGGSWARPSQAWTRSGCPWASSTRRRCRGAPVPAGPRGALAGGRGEGAPDRRRGHRVRGEGGVTRMP